MNRNLQSIKMRYGIIGRSKLLDRALDTAVRVANTDLTVLISGESGVGKEVFSKIIHQLSPRKHNNFIAVNCGAIPAGTINSELFGHEKGAFTGATSDRKGYFETVHNGTIFLDEIGDMPLDTQAYLLRVLESGEFLKVGSSKVLHTDVRVIAATNVDLMQKVAKGKFREDLFYRLNTVPIKLPALQERPEDIPILFRKFAVDFAENYKTEAIQLNEQATRLLQSYRWPGNIRELKNMAEQLSIMVEERIISPEIIVEHFPHILKRNLPMIARKDKHGDSMAEREILYKLLFEMKSDLTDVKKLVFELISNNDLQVPDKADLKSLSTPALPDLSSRREDYTAPLSEDYQHYQSEGETDNKSAFKPIILGPDDDHYDKMEVVEENLSLEEMEKEMIVKALKKHKGRRKEAAEDLGISERTLYRKIKHYKIEL